MTIWFRHLTADWFIIRQPQLKNIPFVLTTPDHGRIIITALNSRAAMQGITKGMAVADARALVSSLQVFDDIPGLEEKLLTMLAHWCIRFTPDVAIDLPDGLILDTTGCAHLWGDERGYLKEIVGRLRKRGYDVRASIADTIGTAWGNTRFGEVTPLIEKGNNVNALYPLPPAALRLEQANIERLHKLGLTHIGSFISIPRSVLRRRFGKHLLLRLDQALGIEEEMITPVQPKISWQERLPCLEPIRTLTGIEIALNKLLETLCKKLEQEGKGLRSAVFKGYCLDGRIEEVTIGTNRPVNTVSHLFKLFEEKIQTIEPDLGIELFMLEAPKVEEVKPLQETLWTGGCGLENNHLAILLDRVTNKLGTGVIHRYLPDEHHWPERSIKLANDITEQSATSWPTHRPRPIYLLPEPEPVLVTAPIPDYPPMSFRYNGQLHKVERADGPERIEREWWLDSGQHRDYYIVEDEHGCRYWLFRLGHYDTKQPPAWFIHGFFA